MEQPTDNQRPHFRAYTEELAALVLEHSDDRNRMRAVWQELWHRRARQARMLRPFVDALMECHMEAFPWPATDAQQAQTGHVLNLPVEHGLLAELGYAVGHRGLLQSRRRCLLCEVFEHTLPRVAPEKYIKQWGAPSSALRLRKLAATIAAFARNAKRRRDPPTEAIREWESDLEFLRTRYHVDRFDFTWPSVESPPQQMARASP